MISMSNRSRRMKAWKNKMAQYHVGCGIAGIYAGTITKKGDKWLNKSDVTDEAIDAVLHYMYDQIPEGQNSFAYGFKMRSGEYARLKIEVTDECPEWWQND